MSAHPLLHRLANSLAGFSTARPAGVQGDWDINDFDGVTAGIQSLQFNIGPAGGTLKALFGSNLTINDGSATPGVATQLMGSGDLTFAGGGRYTLNGGTPQFTGFTGNVTVDGGILTVGHSEALGGRQGQVVTLKPGSAIINNTGFGLGLNGLPNNIAFGSGPIYLNGGTLLFNIANATTGIALGGLGNNIEVNANSQITLDNGALAGTDNDLAFGSLKINGPYTLRLFSFDSMDASFTGTHVFTGVPTIDMTQATSGGNGTGFFTLNVAITGSGFFIGGSNAVNDATSILQVGGGEAVANTYNGKVTVLLGVGSTGSNSEDLVVQLNKAAGTTAITGDLEINGGTVRNMFNDQIASTNNLVINQGQYDANGKNETIASVTMRGGNFRTSSAAAGGSTVTVTGDFEITGADDLTGSGDGVAANSNTTLTIGGTLRMNGYAKGTIGATNSVMNVGGLEMTGTTLTFNASGNALMRLHGDVTTFASSTMARLGNNTTTSSLQLNGTRTFTVADGTAGIDLSVSTAVVDSAAPVAVGSFIKAGPGTLQLEGAAQVNAYTGTTAVNEGSLVLFKSVGVNAIPAGALTFGDGLGGANAGKVIVRNSNQIADANNVTIASSGLLDLFTFNTSEQVNSLSGSGNVELGPGSTLTVSGVPSTSFSAASPARAA